MVAEILAHFSVDSGVRLLISGLERGESANETQVRTGLSAKEFDAARKRLSRGLEQLFGAKGKIG